MKRRTRTKPSAGTLPVPLSAESMCNHGAHRSPTVGENSMTARFPSASWRTIIAAAGVIALAGVVAYCNSFGGTYAYDDQEAIVENLTIRRLWPIWPVLTPPPHGETVSGRPLLNLSLAINYAFGGLNVWDYHATNLLIHIGAALVLFGILRRTFLLPALRDRFGGAAAPLALASTLLWMLHPLQTESVTYIVQRAESLMGFFYLLTLYCVIRGAGAGTVPFFALRDAALPADAAGEKGDCPPSLRSPYAWPWYAAAVLACLLGMATKEVVVTAPLVVLLYDRTFLAGSFRQALWRRWGLYVGLVATWGRLAYLVCSTGLIARQAELGAPDSWSYARTQPGVILHYLRLSFWPTRLCMSYEWPVANRLGETLPGTIVVGLLLAATVWGLIGRRVWGFLGAWFLLILAPTSSFMPLNQLVHEHRTYLSLAALAVLVVTGGYALWGRLLPKSTRPGYGATAVQWTAPAVVLAALLLTLGYITVQRNSVYRTSLAIWQDTVDKCPASPVAHNNLGNALTALARTEEAMQHYRQALRLKADYADAYNNLGKAQDDLGRTEEAIKLYRAALHLRPNKAVPHFNLGHALADLGRTEEAIEHYRQALQLNPEYADAHNNLGNLLARRGETNRAIAHYQEALRLKPDYADAHNNLAAVFAAKGMTREAIEHLQQALQLRPDNADAHNNLAAALAQAGKTEEAIRQYQEAARLKPDLAVVRYNLATALAQVGRTDEALQHYQQALRLKPDFAPAHYHLARILDAQGRTEEAAAHYSAFLQQTPDSREGLHGLAWLLATREPAQGGDPAQAVQLAQRARELGGEDIAECLDTLAAAYAAAGRFDEAALAAERAVQLAQSAEQATLARNIQSRLELYRAGRPYREAPRSAAQPDP